MAKTRTAHLESEGEVSEVVTSEKELAGAIKNNVDEIIVEGNAKNGVLRIKATGKVAWGVCAVSLAATITLGIVAVATAPEPVSSGVSLVAGVATSSVAAVTLGTAVVPAVLIGVYAGGIGALNTLRDKYKIVEENERYIKLKRK